MGKVIDLGFMPPNHPYLTQGTVLVGVRGRKPNTEPPSIQKTDALSPKQDDSSTDIVMPGEPLNKSC
jgi:hypothetical protein